MLKKTCVVIYYVIKILKKIPELNTGYGLKCIQSLQLEWYNAFTHREYKPFRQ